MHGAELMAVAVHLCQTLPAGVATPSGPSGLVWKHWAPFCQRVAFLATRVASPSVDGVDGWQPFAVRRRGVVSRKHAYRQLAENGRLRGVLRWRLGTVEVGMIRKIFPGQVLMVHTGVLTDVTQCICTFC